VSRHSPTVPFWAEPQHARRRPGLLTRTRLKAALRDWFTTRDFWEVETGIIQVSPGNETHLHGFATDWIAPGETRVTGYLQTSPEFAMKKLLAAGEQRLFQFAPTFRGREVSRLHAPEFTMLEWYRAGEDYAVLMADCAQVLRLSAEIGGRKALSFRGRTCDPFAEPERLSLQDAFIHHAGIALEPLLDQRDAMAEAAAGIGIRIAPDDTWGDIFSRVLSERIEPNLGIGRATVLDRYPISEAALARPCPDDPRFAERFELYVCGVELANAFGELTDPDEQRRRFEADMAEKQRIYGERYPLDEDLLAALAFMPPASGIALGFDRLAMLAAGVEQVADVMFTPWPLRDPAGEPA
jgi:elongation factor P--(R)-beta-lysine ligase